MQRHFRYSLMTLCLGSVLLYTMHVAHNPTARTAGLRVSNTPAVEESATTPQSIRSKPARHSTAWNQESPAQLVATAEVAAIDHILPGATKDDVLSTLGPPTSVDAEQDRWSYDDQVVLFQDDVVIGTLKPDMAQVNRAAFASFSDLSGERIPATPAPATPKARTARTLSASSYAAPSIPVPQPNQRNRMYQYSSTVAASSFDRAKMRMDSALRSATPFNIGPSVGTTALFEPLSSVSRKRFGYNTTSRRTVSLVR